MIPTLEQAAETAAGIVLSGYVERWVEGAIFPSEMAFFLAVCENAGVTRVIESGRQDGYSTEILGDWASRGGREVISIDLEQDAPRAAACRARLVHLPINVVKGSAYTEFGRWSAMQSDRPTAFLADGPKGWPAISMMAAATSANVRAVALHNLSVGSKERKLFESLGGPDVFYEGAIKNPGPLWLKLRAREIDIVTKAGAVRSVDVSSLGVLKLEKHNMEKFRTLRRQEFGFHQPAFVRAVWATGAYGMATKLYGLSSRVLGR